MSDREKRQAENERIAALGELLSQHEHDFSEHHWNKVASRLVAFAPRVIELLSPPAPVVHRDLRQQQVNEVDSADWWAEHVHHLKREYEDALAILERIRQGRMAEFDPDERDQDRADDRAREARQDEAANENAPTAKGAA